MGVFEWIQARLDENRRINAAVNTIRASENTEALDVIYKSLPADVRDFPSVKLEYSTRKEYLATKEIDIENPLTPVILGFLRDWKETVAKYDLDDPAKADEKLAGLAADVMALSATAGVAELALGSFPNDMGTVASMKVSQAMGWLGVGAVVTAVAHDPVKIGLLRPYQDSLEAHFRNRRPMDMQLFQAYKTRELSPAKVEDLSKLDDKVMDAIEAENQTFYDREIAKWGYSEWFANALSRSATVTLNFSQLTSLARQGLLTRGLAIYSLWGQGLDRTVMKPALDALMKQNEMASYEGFRSLVEPSYIEGDITEEELRAYWTKIMVPPDVQNWVLPRLKKRRDAYALKQKTGAAVKERDLTVSQVQQAYQNGLQDRAHAQNMILALGYSMDETKVLLDLAELRRKLPTATSLKRLPLSDYEKAFKNKLIGQEKVLARMMGEYTQEDIALEKALLESGKA